ncbi:MULTISPECIES: helix-turn-helix transcriptional regulator [Aerococcus]|uniref:helix-turn-helix transcriptional regulator n=1 Tax=Aerococcus TaxID=1375 RepID=UPI0008A3EF34|nr:MULTISPECIES: helix-turn-helix transcriptional regulator [Aerococcus]OFT94824.1 transcriptional regulator [Aerococcus sp. HMSC23C02]
MNHVRSYRQKLGISQAELARRVEGARQTINLIENDKYNPSLDLCLRLAHALGTDLNQLFWNEEES